MEAVILMGIQASGKSSFWKARYCDTHVRINLDMLKTRHREALILGACCETHQPFVVDNTNPDRADRKKYINAAKLAGMRVIGYYFESSIELSLERNAQRPARSKVPDLGIRATHSKLQLPTRDEGFDDLYYVRLAQGGFDVEDWNE